MFVVLRWVASRWVHSVQGLSTRLCSVSGCDEEIEHTLVEDAMTEVARG